MSFNSPPLLPIYKLRAVFHGTATVLDPYCGSIFKASIYPGNRSGGPTWRITCPKSNEFGCGRIYIPRMHLSEPPAGRHHIPDDYIIPRYHRESCGAKYNPEIKCQCDRNGLREAFPEGDLYEWRSRWPAHQFYVDKTGELVERVEELAQEMEKSGVQYYTALGKAFEKVREEWRVAQG